MINERVIHFLWDVPVQSTMKVSNYTIIRLTFFLEIPSMSELDLFLTSNLNTVSSASTPYGSFSFVYNRTERRLACQDSESLPCPSGLSRQVRLFCLLNGHTVFPELRQAHQPAFLSL